MHTELVKVPRAEAKILYRKYKEHLAYSKPVDAEIARAYNLLSKGKVVIRALESIKQAGLNRDFLPKLALVPADADACHLRRDSNGAFVMSPTDNFWLKTNRFRFKENTFRFPLESFHEWRDSSGRSHRATQSTHRAMTPIVPVYLRPKRGLANYHVLFEAEWEPFPPRDPYLLRRIGRADLWLVVAHWNLTEVELAALATRV